MSDNEYPGRVETTAVYFLNETSNTLTAELRGRWSSIRMRIRQRCAVEALLDGPSSNEELDGCCAGRHDARLHRIFA